MKRKSELIQKEKSFDDNIEVLQRRKNIIIQENLVIREDLWQKTGDAIPYYFMEIKNENVTKRSVVDVNVSYQVVEKFNIKLKPSTNSLDGKWILYASEKPVTDFGATIIIQNEVI